MKKIIMKNVLKTFIFAIKKQRKFEKSVLLLKLLTYLMILSLGYYDWVKICVHFAHSS